MLHEEISKPDLQELKSGTVEEWLASTKQYLVLALNSVGC